MRQQYEEEEGARRERMFTREIIRATKKLQHDLKVEAQGLAWCELEV